MITETQKKTARRVKDLLYLRRIKPAQIAKLAGVSPVTVRSVLNGHGTSRKVQETIAMMLNRPYEWLWGDRRGLHGLITANKRKAVNE